MTREGNTEHFQTKVTPALAERVRRAAERAGLKPSQWIRRTIESHLDGGQVPDGPPPATGWVSGRPTREEIRAQLDSICDETPQAGESERFELPHIIGEDGMCQGGCDPDLDARCTISAEARKPKRRR